MGWSRIDYAVITGIVILAGCLRFPGIDQPNSIVFDERASVTFVLEYMYKKPYFDVHPPFAQMFFSAIAGLNNKPTYQNKIINRDEIFGDFPYLSLRYVNALIGCLIPATIFILAKLLYKKTYLAIIPAWLVIWDNALVLYSRLILPENLMLFTGLTGVMLVFLFTFNKTVRGRNWILCCAGLFIGIAISVKWIAFGFAVMALAVLVTNKRFKQALVLMVIIAIVHLEIWMVFFNRLPSGRNIPFSIYEKLYVQIEYPAMNNKFDILWYLPAHFVHMFGANTVYQQHESASHPWEWLLGLGKIPIFINTAKNAVIVLSGNQIAWLTVPGALLFGWVILSGPRREKWLNISKEHLSVVVWGFVFFFVPFLFVGRVVFLYHYFSALLCGYLLVPIVIKFSMQKWGKWVWEGYLGLVLLGFMLTAPVTYALRVWSPWIEILTK